MSGWFALLLDGLLAASLLGLGWATLASPRPRQAVVLFIVFGLVLALVWARLLAPDLALAEAAIGAGLAGALLLTALGDEPEADQAPPARGPSATLVSLLCLGLAGVLAWAYLAAIGGADPDRLATLVLERVPESGVSNPVTAVLLNFRGYDTLLELAVLLMALLGILSLGPERPAHGPPPLALGGLARVLVPPLILTGGYLLWVGAHAPGGAFQAGALLAAAGVLARLAGWPAAGLPGERAARGLAVAGVAAFLVVGLALLLAGRPFLAYPPDWAGALILFIETAATLAIPVTLVVAFLGGRPAAWAPPGPGPGDPPAGQATGREGDSSC